MEEKEAKKISPLSKESIIKRVTKMIDMQASVLVNLQDHHVFISKGNRKTGDLVPSVSLIPVISCRNCGQCCKFCYDLRNDCLYPTVQKTRAVNTTIVQYDTERYWSEISKFCKSQRFFRWHVGGDILGEWYWEGVVRVANENPNCVFLIFTKMYSLINSYLDNGGVIPQNLRVVFSAWPGMSMQNPHNFPTSHPKFADGTTTAHEGAKSCPGNCTECALNGNGCFDMKPGEEVIFLAH